MTAPIDLLLARLEGVRKKAAGGWLAKCPAHDDRSPSLSIDQGDDGRALIWCFAGCDRADVVAAVGLSLGDLFEKRLHDTSGRLRRSRPSMSARDALEALEHERLVMLDIISAEVKRGTAPADELDRLIVAGRRINRLMEITR